MCERVYLKYAQEGFIPLASSAEPLKEFEVTDVKQNIFPFHIFIMWLKHQPQAYEWFLTIRAHYPDVVRHFEIIEAMKKSKTANSSYQHLITTLVNRVEWVG